MRNRFEHGFLTRRLPGDHIERSAFVGRGSLLDRNDSGALRFHSGEFGRMDKIGLDAGQFLAQTGENSLIGSLGERLSHLGQPVFHRAEALSELGLPHGLMLELVFQPRERLLKTRIAFGVAGELFNQLFRPSPRSIKKGRFFEAEAISCS